ncbi:hypothetical protein AJ80_08529 [Polytolypa hystricis UAMH7299]|uniref:Rhodopsin domain-containing protein n=1 Tax=Polytolypa hystricis (strain UAMH7299) TaxID=1447883 RepID=A0A2B7X6Y6_POLH7|nr:hypothetical protein AJ80_08529 [Polytolypa hystricis UAMH7299]
MSSSLSARSYGLGGRARNMIIVEFVMTTTAMLLVANRIFSRRCMGKAWAADDFAIVASMVFCIAMNVVNMVGVNYGYGRPSKSLSSDDLITVMKLFFALQILYKFTINLTKISILLLYRRLFDTRRFRLICHLVLFYVAMYGLASIIATGLECSPIRRVFDKAVEGSCIDLTAFWYTTATSNIVTDIVILILPLPVIQTLRLPKRQKYGLMLIFTLGIFVCATSIIRMTTLNLSSRSLDQSAGTLVSTLWTIVEANTAIICACLPMIRCTLSLLFPHLFPAFCIGEQPSGTRRSAGVAMLQQQQRRQQDGDIEEAKAPECITTEVTEAGRVVAVPSSNENHARAEEVKDEMELRRNSSATVVAA